VTGLGASSHSGDVRVRTAVWGAALAAGAAAIGHVALRTPEGEEADLDLFEALNAGHGPAADRYFGGVTELGSLYAAGAAAGALVALGRRRTALSAAAAAGVTWLLGQGVKNLVLRPRPYETDAHGSRTVIAAPQGTSWPSSHPAVLTAFTRVAARDLGLSAVSRAALTGLDLSVAASRVYLGVHYPSDVASGLLMGRAVARLWPRARS
jgi:membrane-associated phospholipid phosphatase